MDREEKRPEIIAQKAAQEAEYKGYDVLIVDTSGRLHIDEELMDELVRIKDTVKPHEILLVVDALTGQDAVTAAEGFNDAIGIDGIIMTKLDGDSRGGAALSVKAVTGKPIKFAGMGEKFDALEPFHPERMACRILGMGDMLSLIEKAQENYDEKQAEDLEKKICAKSVYSRGLSGADGSDPARWAVWARLHAICSPAWAVERSQRRRTWNRSEKRIRPDGSDYPVP